MYDYEMQFVNQSNGLSIASYQGGPFLAQLFSLFTAIASSSLPASPVLSMHATHDTTIKPVLNFFGQVLAVATASARLVTCDTHWPCDM